MFKPYWVTTVILGGLFAPAYSIAGEFDYSGFAALDTRIYQSKPLHAGQDDAHINPSFVIEPEINYSWNEGDDRIDFVGFLRVDGHDSRRTHADIRELKYLHIGDGWDLRIGADKVFWGVTESRHLVDIINQTDAVEDIDGEDKLGQPMVNLGFQEDWGDLNFLFMPYFRERTFPGIDGRHRGSLLIDHDQTVYEAGAEEWAPDFAVRFSTFIEDWDIGGYHFYGTARDPRFEVGLSDDGDAVLIPHYDRIHQTGLDVQATFDEWLYKLEVMRQSGSGDSFFAASGGFEYTFFGLFDDTGDLGVLAEYHYDGRNHTNAASLFDNDFFAGARLTLNDEDDTDFLAGVLFDAGNGASSLVIEADRRLSDNWTIELEGRMTLKAQQTEVTYGARKDNHIQFRLARYF